VHRSTHCLDGDKPWNAMRRRLPDARARRGAGAVPRRRLHARRARLHGRVLGAKGAGTQPRARRVGAGPAERNSPRLAAVLGAWHRRATYGTQASTCGVEGTAFLVKQDQERVRSKPPPSQSDAPERALPR